MVSANYESYKSVMRKAYSDGLITDEETALLDTLRQSLNISSDEHQQAEEEVKKELENGGPPNPANDNPNPSNDAPPEGTPDDYNIIRPGMNSGEVGVGDPENPMNDAMNGIGAEETGQAGSPPPDEPGEPTTIEDFIKAGKAAYHKNDFQSAIGSFDKALELEPDNSEALFFRKRSQSKLNEKSTPADGGATGAAVGMNPGGVAASTANTAIEGGMAEVPNVGEMKGDPGCSSCNGAGTCRWCKATGGCYWCKGTGQCDKCKGTGVLKGQQCSSCAGSGKCHSCKGNGKCYWCQGNGRCNKCNA
jgi:hypothetical protein